MLRVNLKWWSMQFARIAQPRWAGEWSGKWRRKSGGLLQEVKSNSIFSFGQSLHHHHTLGKEEDKYCLVLFGNIFISNISFFFFGIVEKSFYDDDDCREMNGWKMSEELSGMSKVAKESVWHSRCIMKRAKNYVTMKKFGSIMCVRIGWFWLPIQ